MLEPGEFDLPALFLVLVVLPLVTCILLGKWSEAVKKKQRISLLSQLAAEEALRAGAIAAAAVIPLTLVPSSDNRIHECARCFSPTITAASDASPFATGLFNDEKWKEAMEKLLW